jgi:hypothetical protein
MSDPGNADLEEGRRFAIILNTAIMRSASRIGSTVVAHQSFVHLTRPGAQL